MRILRKIVFILFLFIPCAIYSQQKPEIVWMTGGPSVINHLEISPDGKYIVTDNYDHGLKVWSTKDFTCFKLLPVQSEYGSDYFDISPNSQLIASIDAIKKDAFVIIDVASGKIIKRITVSDKVLDFVFYNDNRNLIVSTQSEDKKSSKLFLLDYKTEAIIKELPTGDNPIKTIEITPNRKRLVAAHFDGKVSFVDLVNWKFEKTMNSELDSYLMHYITISGNLAILSDGYGNIYIYDLNTLELVKSLKVIDKFGCDNALAQAIITPDEKTLIASISNRIQIINLTDGKVIKTIETKNQTYGSLAVSPDKKSIIMGGYNQTIDLLNLSNYEISPISKSQSGLIIALSFSNDSKYLISSTQDNNALVIRSFDGKVISDLGILNYFLPFIQIETNNKKLITVSNSFDRYVKEWDIEKNDFTKTLFYVQCTKNYSDCFALSEKYFAYTDYDTINIVDRTTWKLKAQLKGHTDILYSLAISNNSQYLISGSKDNTYKLWDLSNNRIIATMPHRCYYSHSAQFSSDSQTIMFYDGSKFHKNRVTDGGPISEFKIDTNYRPIAISPDSKIADSINRKSDGTLIKFWRISDGALLTWCDDFIFKDSELIAISPDNKYVAIGKSNGDVIVINNPVKYSENTQF